ncbi:MAG: hypothetical protein KKH88_03700 [Nanoarchaeota archaeon]|nr:hypothetical protein [Nanoarchaeota archaeon]
MIKLEKYLADNSDTLYSISGSLLKYASFLGGVYTVMEKDLGIGIVAGICYLVGDIAQLKSKNSSAVKRFSLLEEALKEQEEIIS